MNKVYALMTTMMVVVLVCVAGCNAPPSSSYIVSLDPKLSADWQEAAWNAADAWNKVLDGALQATFNYTGCLHVDHEICVYPSTKAEVVAMGSSDGAIGFTDHHWFTDSSEVYIPMDDNQNDSQELRQQLLAHEVFGHGCAIDFHLTAGNVMCAGVDCASPVPTCQDGAAWWAQRVSSAWGWQGNRTCPPTSFTISGK